MAETAVEPKALESKLNKSLDELIREAPRGHGGVYPRGGGRDSGHGGRGGARVVPAHAPHADRGDAARGRWGGHGRHGGFRDRGPQRLVRFDGPSLGPMLPPDPAFMAQQLASGAFNVRGFGVPIMRMPGPTDRQFDRGFAPGSGGGFGVLNGGFAGDFMGPPEPPFVQPPRPPILRCFVEPDSGDVIVVFKNTEIIKVAPNGDITLDSGGFHGPALFKVLNDTLSVVGIRVTTSDGDVWSVSEGRSLMRFSDGMVLKARPPALKERGELVKQHLLHPGGSAAAAATAASNAAAAAVGLMPAAGGPAAPGLVPGALPHFGGRGPMRGRGRAGFGGWGPGGPSPASTGRGFPPGQGPLGRMPDAGAAGGYGKDADHVRRLKAQGRYVPY